MTLYSSNCQRFSINSSSIVESGQKKAEVSMTGMFTSDLKTSAYFYPALPMEKSPDFYLIVKA
jgi:hypothetical protein